MHCWTVVAYLLYYLSQVLFLLFAIIFSLFLCGYVYSPVFKRVSKLSYRVPISYSLSSLIKYVYYILDHVTSVTSSVRQQITEPDRE